MAITIDDLPYVHRGSPASYLPDARRSTSEILRVLGAHRAPAVGFVNEGKLSASGERDERIALLRDWLDAGMTLGNHTYSHPDFNRQTVEQFQREIVSGEKVTRRLSASRKPYQLYCEDSRRAATASSRLTRPWWTPRIRPATRTWVRSVRHGCFDGRRASTRTSVSRTIRRFRRFRTVACPGLVP